MAYFRAIGGASAEVFRADTGPSQDDFWSQLQRDWDKAAEENPSTLGWLKETPPDTSSEVMHNTSPLVALQDQDLAVALAVVLHNSCRQKESFLSFGLYSTSLSRRILTRNMEILSTRGCKREPKGICLVPFFCLNQLFKKTRII